MRARYRGRSESLGKSPSWSANASPFVGGFRLAVGEWDFRDWGLGRDSLTWGWRIEDF